MTRARPSLSLRTTFRPSFPLPPVTAILTVASSSWLAGPSGGRSPLASAAPAARHLSPSLGPIAVTAAMARAELVYIFPVRFSRRPLDCCSIRHLARCYPPRPRGPPALRPPVRLDPSETNRKIVASESTAKTETSITEHLNELVLTSSDVGEFLHELARISARSLSEPGDEAPA